MCLNSIARGKLTPEKNSGQALNPSLIKRVTFSEGMTLPKNRVK
jgi:hypothetical protein